MTSPLRRRWRILFALATTVAVTMALLPHPPKVPIDGDKYQHMLAFGVITILSMMAYPKAELRRVGERLSFLGAMIELIQSIPALHRDCDIMDWVADTSIIIGVLTVVAINRRRRGAT